MRVHARLLLYANFILQLTKKCKLFVSFVHSMRGREHFNESWDGLFKAPFSCIRRKYVRDLCRFNVKLIIKILPDLLVKEIQR